jgi:hypothetical protein
MPRLTVRTTERTIRGLDSLAAERGMNRSRVVRQILEAAVDGEGVDLPETPSEDELLELLAEKARQGNVAAIRTLLAREEQLDPHERALLAFEQIAEGHRQ